HGYKVSMFEANDRPGGMLTSCIPEFRLPSTVAVKELSILEKAGVEIHYNTVIGKTVSLQSLAEEYNAVILAVGLQNSKKLDFPGEDSQNVYSVLEFLRRSRDGQLKDSIGQNVVVIGGGNAAIDAGQAALRLGAANVQLVCLEQREEMPAFGWEIEEALEEGIQITNGWGPASFQVDKGQITGVEFNKCLSIFDDKDKFAPVFSEQERMTLVADTVIVAIGQQIDLNFSNGTGLDVKQGVIVVDPITLLTSIANIFAAGDAIPGKKSVVDAMALGREAAESVSRMLEGLPLEYARDRNAGYEMAVPVETNTDAQYPRIEIPMLDVKGRKTFAELEGCLSRKDAEKEAARCMSCGETYGKYRTCWSCLPCEVVCPEKALAVKVPYLMR
ncbi:MAG TPA: FAD-dependent oxidoreductase, partial [Desulfosporosinus sp.]|nr:FAD-dependent oxidoreductase [Desulfosporosinus sp.]